MKYVIVVKNSNLLNNVKKSVINFMINKNDKIFVAGHNGLIGSAIIRELKSKGYKRIITIEKKK